MADSTINGLTALTGANVDNTADQLAIWDNSDSTTKKITRTELMVGLPAGTAAAPAISFSGSAGTGMYLSAANVLAFATNGTLRFSIGSSGRLYPATTGTVDEPSIARGGDADTGMWWPTTNTLGFSTGAAEAMRIDSSQRLLIGGASTPTLPDGTGVVFTPKTIVQASSGIVGLSVAVQDGTRNRRIGLFVDDTNGIQGISSNYSTSQIPFVYRDATAERLRIDSSGNVGIGVTNPLAKLSVYGALQSAATKATIATFDTQTYAANVGAGIALGGLVDAGTSYASFALIGGRKENATLGDTAGYFVVETRPTAAGNLTERLRITSTGEVQIAAAGTAAVPAITVGGDTDTGIWYNANNSLSIATGGATRAIFNSSGVTVNVAGSAGAPSLFKDSAGLFWPSGTSIAISTGGTERLRLDSTGNVIVNTAAVATTATDGFLYVAGCAGTPTGVPTAYTGRVPIVVDTTNNKLYFYSGGAWRDAGP